MKGMNEGWALFYENGEMNLNYFEYRKRDCYHEIAEWYGEPWRKLKKQGFSVRKIKAKEVRK